MSRNRAHAKTNKPKKNQTTTPRKRAKWFLGQRTGLVIAALLVSALAIGELYVQLVGPNATSVPGWIIDGDQLQNLEKFLPSSLVKTYFDTKTTVVLKNFMNSGDLVPSGWRSQTGNHYTSFTAHGCGSGCTSLQRDIASGKFNGRPKPVVMYDDEHWVRTPRLEQVNVCSAMSTFVSAAHQQGLTTILAPDQDLAQPGVISTYQGGESENWQTYLRLGLGGCAAKTGSEWYHIMSQPFEAHWCGNLFGKCQSSESDFVNFVTQAALQARAINPSIQISDGLSTNPHYFGYFRGAETLAHIMYRDYADVQRQVNAVWLNVVGRNADTTALYFLSMLGKDEHATRRSSVLFLRADKSLQNTSPHAGKAQKFSLQKGSGITFTSAQTLAGGTSVPAGTGEFQFWTDGRDSESAKLGVLFGYCSGAGCQHRTAIKNMSVLIHGGAQGAAAASGAFTTGASRALPKHGSYHLYIQLRVQSSAPFSLLYDSATAATNLATPVLLPF